MGEQIFIPEYIQALLACLEAAGHTGYLVGGCVRDALMGRVPTDYDIAVDATPDVLPGCFPGYTVLPTGIAYGTVTVLADGHPVEVTCFRREGAYRDGRHPDEVRYCATIEEDLSRRDFTVNAMAYRPDTGLCDPFGGAADLAKKQLSCVGDANERFSEDALRILRAMRFCAVLGLRPDPELLNAANRQSLLLREISVERVLAEMKKMLCGENIAWVLSRFAVPLCAVIPEMGLAVGFDQKNPHHIYTVYDHIAVTVASCPPDPILRLTMLLHDIAKPYVMTEDAEGVRHFRGHQDRGAEMARDILTRLRCDRKTIEKVCTLIRFHDLRPAPERGALHRYVIEVGGYENALLLTHVRRADLSAQAPAYHFQFPGIDAAEQMLRQMQEAGAPADVSGLAVNGADLIALGVPTGPRIGSLLSELLAAVAAGQVENTRAALTQHIRETAGIL